MTDWLNGWMNEQSEYEKKNIEMNEWTLYVGWRFMMIKKTKSADVKH